MTYGDLLPGDVILYNPVPLDPRLRSTFTILSVDRDPHMRDSINDTYNAYKHFTVLLHSEQSGITIRTFDWCCSINIESKDSKVVRTLTVDRGVR